MKNYISLKDENGNVVNCEVLLTYLSPVSNKNYIVYKENEDEVCVNFYNENTNELSEIINEEDWNEIEGVIKKYL